MGTRDVIVLVSPHGISVNLGSERNSLSEVLQLAGHLLNRENYYPFSVGVLLVSHCLAKFYLHCLAPPPTCFITYDFVKGYSSYCIRFVCTGVCFHNFICGRVYYYFMLYLIYFLVHKHSPCIDLCRGVALLLET